MKKLTLILTLTLVLGLSSAAYGKSRNFIEEGSIKGAGEPVSASLIINPDDEVTTGTAIEIEFENAVVFSSNVINGIGNPSDKGYKSYGYQWRERGKNWDGTTGFYDIISDINTEELPYKITRLSDYKIRVTLCNIPKDYASMTYTSFNRHNNEYYYKIPLPVYVKNDGSVRLKITGRVNDNTINHTSHIFNGTVTKETTTKVIETTTEATTGNVKEKDIINHVEITIGRSIMYVNSTPQKINVPPYIQPKTKATLIPLRAVTLAVANGYNGTGNIDTVSWDGITKSAIINYMDKIIEFRAGSQTMKVNGVEKPITGGIPEITEGRMFVPFRVLGEELGAEVNWNSETKTAIYN